MPPADGREAPPAFCFRRATRINVSTPVQPSGITLGISGAHRRLLMRGMLSARPLHAYVRFRLSLVRQSHHIPPPMINALAAPDGEQAVAIAKAQDQRGGETARVITSATHCRLVREQAS